MDVMKPTESLAECLDTLENPPLSPKDIESMIELLTEVRDYLIQQEKWLTAANITFPQQLQASPADIGFLHELETDRFKANLPK